MFKVVPKGTDKEKKLARKKQRQRNSLPPFVPLTWGILNHAAYKDLPASAAKALPYFMGKVKVSYRDPQKYWEEFAFSYREASKLRFASGTWSKVIQDLVAYGWIDPVDRGGLRGDGKSSSLFRLSRRWEKYGTADFENKSWKCFMPRQRRSTVASKCEKYNCKI